MDKLMCDQCFDSAESVERLTNETGPTGEGDQHIVHFANAPVHKCGFFRPKIELPKMSDEEYVRLAQLIKPLYQFNSRGPRYIRDVDLHDVAFTWAPKRRLVRPRTHPAAKKLEAYKTIRTFHEWAYYGFFKPSVGEVLCQIPDEDLEVAVAFQITSSPETAEDFNKDRFAFNSGFHLAETTLYRRRHKPRMEETND